MQVQMLVQMPFPRVWPPYVPNKWHNKCFFRSEHHVFVCPQPKRNRDFDSVPWRKESCHPSYGCVMYEQKEISNQQWTRYLADPGFYAFTTRLKPSSIHIVERKEFERQCHLEKKKVRDLFFLDKRHQQFFWRYGTGFNSGQKRLSAQTQIKIINACCNKRHRNRPYSRVDTIVLPDISMFCRLSPQFQQKTIRKFVRDGRFPAVTQFFIQCNALVYEHHDRRRQCREIVGVKLVQKPLVSIVVHYLGFLGFQDFKTCAPNNKTTFIWK